MGSMFFSLVLGSLPLVAEVSQAEIITSARAVAAGTATEKQQLIAFVHNKEINLLALDDDFISPEVYRKNQQAFVERAEKYAIRAAEKEGMQIAVKKNDKPKPGTDTDIQLLSETKITPEQAVKARNNFNELVNDDLKKYDYREAVGNNHAKSTQVDMMATPEQMTDAGFTRHSAELNEDGGVMYTDKKSVKVQQAVDENFKGTTFSDDEALAYQKEMLKNADKMAEHAEQLKQSRPEMTEPDKRRLVDNEIRLCEAKQAKYLARSGEVSTYIERNARHQREKYATTAADGDESTLVTESKYSEKSNQQLKDAQARDSATKTKRAEALVGAQNQHLAEKSVRNFSMAVAEGATVSKKPGEAAKFIADGASSLTNNQKNQLCQDLEIRFGSDNELVKNVRAEIKLAGGTAKPPTTEPAGHQPATNAGRSSRFAGSAAFGLGLVNTVLNVKNSIDKGDSTGKILYDMSILPVLDNVSSQTSTYTVQEIRRLQQKYRDAGENPDTLANKLKIMAEATSKGIIHGTVVGGIDLIRNNAVVGGAETAIFLAGETIDTQNVLETTFAELQNQNMQQSVQNAKALQYGKKAAAELKRLAADAARLRELLGQNTVSARMLSRQAVKNLEELRSISAQGNAELDPDAAMVFPETEARLTSQLAASGNVISGLQQQAVSALNELKAGGAGAAAARSADGLSAIADQQGGELARIQTEISEFAGLATANAGGELVANWSACRAGLDESAAAAVKNAATMRQNEATFKRLIENFATLKQRIETAGALFADKRQSNEGDWLTVKSEVRMVADPDGSLPENFAAEVGTLERVPEQIRSGLATVKAPAATTDKPVAGIASLIHEAVSRLKILHETRVKSLHELRQAIERLRAAAAQRIAEAAETGENALPCGHKPGDPACGTSKCRLICQDAGVAVDWPMLDSDDNESTQKRRMGGIDLKNPNISTDQDESQGRNFNDMEFNYIPSGD